MALRLSDHGDQNLTRLQVVGLPSNAVPEQTYRSSLTQIIYKTVGKTCFVTLQTGLCGCFRYIHSTCERVTYLPIKQEIIKRLTKPIIVVKINNHIVGTHLTTIQNGIHYKTQYKGCTLYNTIQRVYIIQHNTKDVHYKTQYKGCTLYNTIHKGCTLYNTIQRVYIIQHNTQRYTLYNTIQNGIHYTTQYKGCTLYNTIQKVYIIKHNTKWYTL